MMRGINRELIQQALEEEFVADECEQIKELLRKRHFSAESANEAERRKMAQFLMRRGFKSRDIFRMMRIEDEFY